MANYYPKIENLKIIRDTTRAKEIGKLGGIASGKVRKRKSNIKKFFQIYIKLQNYIDILSEEEYLIFIKDFNKEQQEYITNLFIHRKRIRRIYKKK